MNDDRGKKAERTETNGDEGRKGSYNADLRQLIGRKGTEVPDEAKNRRDQKERIEP
jgi:hypothetical protein